MHLQIMPAIRSLKPLIRGAMLYQSLSKALIFSLPLLNEAEKGSTWIKNSTTLIVDKNFSPTLR